MGTLGLVCLLMCLAAVWIAERARQRTAAQETTIELMANEQSMLQRENANLRNQMTVMKARMSKAEAELSKRRGLLEVCASEHYDLSEQVHDFEGQLDSVIDGIKDECWKEPRC